jgi:hypothetical protein
MSHGLGIEPRGIITLANADVLFPQTRRLLHPHCFVLRVTSSKVAVKLVLAADNDNDMQQWMGALTEHCRVATETHGSASFGPYALPYVTCLRCIDSSHTFHRSVWVARLQCHQRKHGFDA